MLDLAIAQVLAAIRDGDKSVDVLTSTFTGMAGYLHTLGDIIRQLPTAAEADGRKAALTGISEQVQTMVHQAVVAFQFYDRLVQRLSHVVTNLDGVRGLVADPGRGDKSDDWRILQQKIRAKLLTEEERAMFDAVLGGIAVPDAIEAHLTSPKQGGDEIELF